MPLLPRSRTQTPPVEEVKQFFLRKGELPTFPAVAAEFMELAQNPYASVLQIAGCVERDPALAAKTLKLANSAYIGYARQVSSIRDAIVLLGLREMRALVLTISVFRAFGDLQKSIPPVWEAYWVHSLAVAQTARRLAKHLGIKDAEQAYLAGLLHDVGKLLYYLYDAPRYLAALERQQTTGGSLLEIERATFGNCHPELGCWLLELWNFPPALAEAVLYHETPELADQSMMLVGLIALSEQLSKAQGLGVGEQLTVDAVALEQSHAWRLLAYNHPRLAETDINTFMRELVDLTGQVRAALVEMKLV
ncbi:MAG TPA: HDOD domain-containing protein [bacterium]|nr:HDOD domain-containing protein [bacterium]